MRDPIDSVSVLVMVGLSFWAAFDTRASVSVALGLAILWWCGLSAYRVRRDSMLGAFTYAVMAAATVVALVWRVGW